VEVEEEAVQRRARTTTTRKATTTKKASTTSKFFLFSTIKPVPTGGPPLPAQPWPSLGLPPVAGKTEYVSPPGPNCYVFEQTAAIYPYVPSCKSTSDRLVQLAELMRDIDEWTPPTIPTPADPRADLIARRDACVGKCGYTIPNIGGCSYHFAVSTTGNGTYCRMRTGYATLLQNFYCGKFQLDITCTFTGNSFGCRKNGDPPPIDLGAGIVYNDIPASKKRSLECREQGLEKRATTTKKAITTTNKVTTTSPLAYFVFPTLPPVTSDSLPLPPKP
jgi:hypothetical protein